MHPTDGPAFCCEGVIELNPFLCVPYRTEFLFTKNPSEPAPTITPWFKCYLKATCKWRGRKYHKEKYSLICSIV